MMDAVAHRQLQKSDRRQLEHAAKINHFGQSFRR